MILKELVDCYDLMMNSDKFDVADFNSSIKRISFKFVINKEGLIKQVLDLQEDKQGVFMSVPLQVTRTNKICPLFLCDNSKYLLGYFYNKDTKSFQYSDKNFEESKKYHEIILKSIEDSKYYKAIMGFFENKDKNIENVQKMDEECLKGGLIVFSLDGDKECIHDIYEIRNQFINYNLGKKNNKPKDNNICLVSGDILDELCTKYEVIKLKGGQQAGSYICFNILSSYKVSAKISYNSMFKYTTALNTLLLSQDNNLYMSGNTVVFWSDKIGCKEEEIFPAFMLEENERDNEIEYNQEGVDEIESVIRLIRKGMTIDVDKINYDSSINMYILGLSPNNARVFIRFWFKNSIGDFVRLSNKHFEDTKLKRKRNIGKKNFVYEEVGVKISSILKTITPYGKTQNVPNTLINSLFKSILTGNIYPISIYNQILGRIRAEVGEDFVINHTRVSFI